MVFMNLGGYAEINVNETNVGIVIPFVVKLQVINSQADHFQLIIICVKFYTTFVSSLFTTG